jgi:leucyl-tRNA synthetase
MRDLGQADIREPFSNLLTQGMVLNEIYFRKPAEGRITYYNPADVDAKLDERGVRVGAVLRSDGRPVESGGIGTMSKSKNNGVDPQALIDKYGADTARFYTMFASPPTNTLEWSDESVEGSFRFLKRVWSFALAHSKAHKTTPQFKDARHEVHSALKQANYDMQRHQFNTVASAAMKILNAIERLPDPGNATATEGLSILIRVLAPITPHLAHHLWRELGFGEDVLRAPWPEPAKDALEQDEVELVVQVNGKLRGSIKVAKSADKKAIEESAVAAAVKYIAGAAVKKVIIVPGRLVNIVV